MVVLDHGLIVCARSLITSANALRARQLIRLYVQAVLLHNQGATKHVVYQERHENELREFTKHEGEREASLEKSPWQNSEWLQEHNQEVMQRAAEAIANAQRAEERCRDLAERVKAALFLGKDG
jgi:alpha-ketoglutarate-dependent taurine dioxygenase